MIITVPPLSSYMNLLLDFYQSYSSSEVCVCHSGAQPVFILLRGAVMRGTAEDPFYCKSKVLWVNERFYSTVDLDRG